MATAPAGIGRTALLRQLRALVLTRCLRRSAAVAAVLLCAVCVQLVSAGIASAATCDTSWARAVSGAWTDGSDWTNGVPTSTTNACITVAGNYTVTLLDGQSAGSLRLGSSTGATTQELDFTGSPGHNATLSLGANSSVLQTGRIVLDSQAGGGYTQISAAGTATLSNSGQIETRVEGPELNYLEVNLTNTSTGAVDVLSGELRQDDNTITTNYGTWKVNASGTPGFTMTTEFDSFVNRTGASVSNGGAITLTNGASWKQAGGNETGNAVSMYSGTLTDNGTASSGRFSLTDTVTVSGAIAAGETVDVTAFPGHNASFDLGSATVINKGTIELNSPSDGGYVDLSDGTVINSGQIETRVEGSQLNYLEVNLTNTHGATVNVISGELSQDNNTITNNYGDVILDAGAELKLTTGSDVFNQKSDGTMTFEIASASSFGTLNLSNGATFSLAGGTADPILQGTYAPRVGTEFDVITGPWGTGRYTTVKNGFSGDYAHPDYLGLVS